MASTTRITRGAAQSGTAAINSTVLITRGTARSFTGTTTTRITRGTAQSGPTTSSTIRITRGAAQSGVPSVLGARAGADRHVDSFEDLLLDGSGSTGMWVSAQWLQVGDSRVGVAFDPASPTVELVGSGAVVVYQAPAAHDEYKLTFELAVSSTTSTSVDTRTDTVYPWLRWRLTPQNTLAPAGHYALMLG